MIRVRSFSNSPSIQQQQHSCSSRDQRISMQILMFKINPNSVTSPTSATMDIADIGYI